MGKKLKLAFVMGGGVSLGTFSSAALTETLKQLILYAQYPTGEKDTAGNPIMARYESVELDIMAGASAGAISLGVLLRTLVNSHDKFKLLGYENYDSMRAKMEQKLLMQHGETAYKLKTGNIPAWESLIAVQIAQELQGKLWIEELNLEKLLGVGANYKDMSYEAGLLNRAAIEQLARNYMQFEQVGNRLVHKAHLLAPRLLFCCTLSNLNPIYKSNHERKGFLKALNDSAVERMHSEKRVFDLHFQPVSSEQGEKLPLKWIQYQQGEDLLTEQSDYNGQKQAKFVRNMDKNEVWREIAATMIASGAFPLAFEPVVLNRYKHEYGEDWPAELGTVTKHPFTYMDGGLFNNEPISEALKLANYLDSQDDSFFDRKVIFVDPHVSELDNNLALGIHNKMSISRGILGGKFSVSTKNSLFRLAAQVPILLGAMLNESDKLAHLDPSTEQQRLNWRKQQRVILQHQSMNVLPTEIWVEMRQTAQLALQQAEKSQLLPFQSLSIQSEIWRISKEEREFVGKFLPMEKGLFMYKLNEFLFVPEPDKVEYAACWLYLLLCLNLDISLNLLGHQQVAEIVPVAPFDFYKNDHSLLKLASGGLSGFAGFASLHAGMYATSYGKFCAYRILVEMGLIGGEMVHQTIPSPFDYNLLDDKLKIDIETAIMKRVKELVPAGLASTLWPLISGAVQDKLGGWINDNLLPATVQRSFDFRIKIPLDLYILRGMDKNGAAYEKNGVTAVKVGQEWFLIARLDYNPETRIFSGANVNSFQLLYLDKTGIFSNTASVAIQLPTITNEMLQSANPVFIADVSAEAKTSAYMEVKADRWHFYTDIVPLDETLWGEDKIRGLYERLT